MLPAKKNRPAENFSTDPNCMNELYVFHEELGCGGFGKVKLATHTLTGERVAIKIIDKKAIGSDLPRVTTELDALKTLAHQNICRLFQYAETEDKFYIVMEYCNGGEMFDYIVKKARLTESEARYFFRQLVQAMAYIHSMGFAHRDLKPENLLLKTDLQLKVIDFGLSARPQHGLSRPLETCCGSPAYAAPELIQNTAYYGNEADVWSMGVLLYALLCGSLPFEDESMPKLYRKIMLGVYHEPSYLTTESKALLKSMLTVNPLNRITIKQLLVHPWLNKNYTQTLKWNTVYHRNLIDEEIAKEMAYYFGAKAEQMNEELRKWKFDYLTATYIILLQRKERKQNFTLPFYKKPLENVVHSPTIHASLEDNLNHYGAIGDSPTERELLLPNKQKAIISGPPSLFCQSPHAANVYSFANATKSIDFETGALKVTNEGKENRWCQPNSTPVRVVVPHTSYSGDECRSANIYCTPRRAAPSQAMYRRPRSVERTRIASASSPPYRPAEASPRQQPLQAFNTIDQRPCPSPVGRGHAQRDCSNGEATPITSSERQGRSQTRKATSPRLRQRIFTSLERKADRVMNLLTPKKMRFEGPARLSSEKTMINVSITSSTDPHHIRSELIRVLNDEGMNICVEGWKISGSKRSNFGGHITVELEVVLIDNLEYVGVRRRRVNGDAMTYKKVCEHILGLAGV